MTDQTQDHESVPATDAAAEAKPAAKKSAPKPAPEAERIAKVMARAGVASRRDAERMILAGRVTVNGQTIDSPALDIGPKDKVALDGKPIDEKQPLRLWLYYKPLGLVVSEKDEKGRQTIFDTLPEGMPRVMSVGRLDLNSEGLLLLTNDGELKRRLELPETGWLRKYRVRVNGRPDNATFDPLRRGATIEGEDFLPMEITLDRQQGANAWLTVGLREGRNREIRRAMTHVGMTVNRLIRVSYGPFRLNEMKVGDIAEVKARVMRDQLGNLLPGAEATGGGERPERVNRSGGSRPRYDNRPPRGEGEEGRAERGPRADRGDRGDRGDRFGDKPRGRSFGSRSHGDEAPARKPRTAGPRRSFDDKPQGERPERGGFERNGERSGGRDFGGPRREPREARDAAGPRDRKSFAPRDGKPAPQGRGRDGEGSGFRSSGDKSSGFKSAGFKSHGGGGAGGGRATGYKSHRGNAEGGRSEGSRSEGFKPRAAYDDGARSSGYKPRGADGERSGERSGGYKPRSAGNEGSGGYKPRGAQGERNGERSGGYKPRSAEGGERSGGFKPRSGFSGGDKSGGKPGGRPGAKFGSKPGAKPAGRSGGAPGNRPGGAPGGRPKPRSGGPKRD